MYINAGFKMIPKIQNINIQVMIVNVIKIYHVLVFNTLMIHQIKRN